MVQVVGSASYVPATDKRHVYLEGFVSKRLHPESFELLGCGFYKDRNGVYNHFMGFENVVTVIDKHTFEVLMPQQCHSEVPHNARDKNLSTNQMASPASESSRDCRPHIMVQIFADTLRK